MYTRRRAFSSHLCPCLILALLCPPRLPPPTPTPKITLRQLLPTPPPHRRRAFNTGRRTRSIRAGEDAEGDGEMRIAWLTIELPLDELLNAEADAEGEEMMGVLRIGEEVQSGESSEHEASSESGSSGMPRPEWGERHGNAYRAWAAVPVPLSDAYFPPELEATEMDSTSAPASSNQTSSTSPPPTSPLGCCVAPSADSAYDHPELESDDGTDDSTDSLAAVHGETCFRLGRLGRGRGCEFGQGYSCRMRSEISWGPGC
ncbi:hypothetical protein B0H13DRAFT_2448561 [Mycena leptocephala]|nr:hypothetical protein B0H13DRAFT_2448561 [Mycena leptocephala]